MKKLTFAAIAVFSLLASVANAQDNPVANHAPAVIVGSTFGVSFGWRGNSDFANIPESLRTIPDSTQTFPADHFIQDLTMGTGQLGIFVNIKNRVELAGGFNMLITGGNSDKNIVQGCYCEGSTVTYFQMLNTGGYYGEYVEGSVRAIGPVWLHVQGLLNNKDTTTIDFKQGFSAYGGDDTLLKQTIATRRVPYGILFGIGLCDCDEDNGVDARLMIGYIPSSTTLNPQFSDIRYTENVRKLAVGFSFNFRLFINHKEKS
ncbi:MAG: hypothetical protein WDN47_04305 [Candidatus Doudnabacteria bacterium]